MKTSVYSCLTKILKTINIILFLNYILIVRNRVMLISAYLNDIAYAPAWGMVGTLIGLINMMKTMGSDSSAIGAGMSLALITTLYGSIIANWVCIPIARKLEKNSEAEYLEKEVIIEGILSIQAGDNTRIINEKLKAILESS